MGKDRKSEFLPFYWKAKYFHDHEALEYAVKTFPNEQKPLVLSIERDIWYLYYATHHLPEGYIGYVDEDLPIVEEVEKRIVRVEDEKTRDELNADFQFYKELILNYLISGGSHPRWRFGEDPILLICVLPARARNPVFVTGKAPRRKRVIGSYVTGILSQIE